MNKINIMGFFSWIPNVGFMDQITSGQPSNFWKLTFSFSLVHFSVVCVFPILIIVGNVYHQRNFNYLLLESCVIRIIWSDTLPHTSTIPLWIEVTSPVPCSNAAVSIKTKLPYIEMRLESSIDQYNQRDILKKITIFLCIYKYGCT